MNRFILRAANSQAFLPVLMEEQQKEDADHLKDNKVLGNIEKSPIVWKNIKGDIRQMRLIHRNSFVDNSQNCQVESHVDKNKEESQKVDQINMLKLCSDWAGLINNQQGSIVVFERVQALLHFNVHWHACTFFFAVVDCQVDGIVHRGVIVQFVTWVVDFMWWGG